MEDVKLPNVHVSNYQKYITGDFLQDAIANHLDPEMDAKLPENLHISIAYIDIRRKAKMIANAAGEPKVAYETNLVLSIKGVSFSYKLMHDNGDLYLAKRGLDIDAYATSAAKDNHIHLFNKAYEAVVFMKAHKITEDLINGYKIK